MSTNPMKLPTPEEVAAEYVPSSETLVSSQIRIIVREAIRDDRARPRGTVDEAAMAAFQLTQDEWVEKYGNDSKNIFRRAVRRLAAHWGITLAGAEPVTEPERVDTTELRRSVENGTGPFADRIRAAADEIDRLRKEAGR